MGRLLEIIVKILGHIVLGILTCGAWFVILLLIWLLKGIFD